MNPWDYLVPERQEVAGEVRLVTLLSVVLLITLKCWHRGAPRSMFQCPEFRSECEADGSARSLP